MKKLFSKLFADKLSRIIRISELLLLFFCIIFFIYEKKTPSVQHFEADDFTVAEVDGDNCLVLRDLSFKRGVYNFSLSAVSSEEGSTMEVTSLKLQGVRLKTGPATLPTTTLSSYVKADMRGAADDISVVIKPNPSAVFEINSLDVFKTTDASKRSLVLSLILIVFVEFFFRLSARDIKVKVRAFILFVMFLLSCYPLYTDYIMGSHDILFHLARIEGLTEGLKSGVFPVKIHPFWGNDYGYAVGTFYGDILLYFPAFLRLMGFSSQSAFKMYAALIQLGTVVISYFSFKRMFKDPDTGLFSSAVYTFASYRLINTYTRAAIGEYTAMMFFPLILCGFYMIFEEGKETYKESLKASAITALGLTGLIGCHVLSCEMIAFFIILALLICIKKVFVKRTFLDLLTALLMTVLLNLGFLVPFIASYFQPLNVRSSSWQGGSSTGIQEYGLSPLQLFSVFGNSSGGSFTSISGINKEVSFNIGFLLLLTLIVFIGFVFLSRDKVRNEANYKASLLMAALGMLSLFMSTQYFPFNSIGSPDKGIGKIISTIQFPWRFVGFTTVFLTFVAAFVFGYIKRNFSREIFIAFVSLCSAILFVSASWYFSNFVMNEEPYRVYDSYEVCNYAFYTGEYLYEGTDYKLMTPNRVIGDGVVVSNYSKNGTSISALLSSESGGSVEFPLNYYKYYVCKADNGQKLSISTGYNNCLKVDVDAGFNQTVNISYKEPLLWRLSELISLLSFAAVTVLLCKINKEI